MRIEVSKGGLRWKNAKATSGLASSRPGRGDKRVTWKRGKSILFGSVATSRPATRVRKPWLGLPGWRPSRSVCTWGARFSCFRSTRPLVAKQVADLDRATGGRLILGVGVGGEYPQEFRAVEIPMEQRGGRTNEIIPLLRKFWTATEVTHRGRYYEIQDVRIHPAPVQPGGPPIVVAGRKEPSMRRAAIMGDGWFPYMYSPRRYADSVQKINTAAELVGRDLAGFHWCAWVFLNIGPDGDVAREEAARTVGGTYMKDVRGMVDRVAAAGTAQEVTAKLQDFYDAGVRHFVFLPVTAGATQRPVLDRLFAEVLPALRDHAAGMS